MKKHALLYFVISIMITVNLVAQSTDSKFKKIKELGGIEQYNYSPNGMNLLLMQDNSVPVVTVQIVYEVGSKHEVMGNTGSAYLLEHLLFKGTDKFNKSKVDLLYLTGH